MSPTRALARPLMSAIFIASGANGLRDSSFMAAAARDAGLSEPEKLAKLHCASNVVGGLALATGRFPRLAALGLAANLVPTTLVGHAFWSAPEDQKAVQQINFFKNVSLLGGLLLAAADTGGRESVPHRIGRVSGRAARKAEKRAAKARKSAAKARARAGQSAASVTGALHRS